MSGEFNIRFQKIVTFKQEGQPVFVRAGVGETIAQIQAGRVGNKFAVGARRFNRPA